MMKIVTKQECIKLLESITAVKLLYNANKEDKNAEANYKGLTKLLVWFSSDEQKTFELIELYYSINLVNVSSIREILRKHLDYIVDLMYENLKEL